MTSLCKLDKNKINKDVVKSGESDFELANKIIQRIYGEIRGMPSNKQIFIGATSGWVFGLLAMKIGRTLALALGGGLILLQIANDKGYISINWKKVNKSLKQDQDGFATNNCKSLGNQEQPISIPNWMKKITTFASQNMSLTVGILGGFLVGLATC